MPKVYRAQVQFLMHICRLECADFIQYWPASVFGDAAAFTIVRVEIDRDYIRDKMPMVRRFLDALGSFHESPDARGMLLEDPDPYMVARMALGLPIAQKEASLTVDEMYIRRVSALLDTDTDPGSETMSGFQAPSFKTMAATILANPEAHVVVRPPKVKKASGPIPTGYVGWVDDQGFTRELTMTGPPVCFFRLVDKATGLVRYPKASMRLVREAELENPGELTGFVKERADFLLMIRAIEEAVLAKAKANPADFFPKAIDADRIVLNSCVKPSVNEEYSTLMTCKIELSNDASQQQKDIDPAHVRLTIRANDGRAVIPVDKMRTNDVYLPIFSSAYPYFSQRGEVGLRFKLNTLQVGNPPDPAIRTRWSDLVWCHLFGWDALVRRSSCAARPTSMSSPLGKSPASAATTFSGSTYPPRIRSNGPVMRRTMTRYWTMRRGRGPSSVGARTASTPARTSRKPRLCDADAHRVHNIAKLSEVLCVVGLFLVDGQQLLGRHHDLAF
jgi:hypothetical protein